MIQIKNKKNRGGISNNFALGFTISGKKILTVPPKTLQQ